MIMYTSTLTPPAAIRSREGMMVRKSFNFIIFLILFLLLVQHPSPGLSEIPCNQVVNLLIPCINYVLYGGTVPPPCCQGVRSLDVPKTSSDRQDICNCLKSISDGVPYAGDVQNNVDAIPTKCGFKLSYSITNSTHCKR